MKKLVVALFSSAILYASAQDVLYYKGMGRAEISNDHLDSSAPFMENDSTTERRDLNGRFVFDLGINVEPNKELRAIALLRLTNQFGGFYSQGSNLEFRQILLQGVLADKFNYQVGDMDLELTPYTLYNNDEIYNEFESDIFAIRRDVMNYENFNNGSKWRMQGMQTNTTLKFNKAIESISLNGFGTRVKKTNFIDTPDRLFMGGDIAIKQSDLLEIGANAVNLFDVVGTTNDILYSYNNSVISGDYSIQYDLDSNNFKLIAFGEFGASKFSYEKVSTDETYTTDGAFVDLGLTAKSKKYNSEVTVSYRSVNNSFNSPGAQTRRIYAAGNPGLFPTGLNGNLSRSQNLFDRVSDQSLYNQSLSPTLMDYNPAYNNATPYGRATPNRNGISIDLKNGNRDSVYFVHLKADLLKEGVGEGIEETRNFTGIGSGFVFNVNKLLDFNKRIVLSTGFKMETTTRDAGAASVDLSSTLIDLGLSVEVVKDLDIIMGLKQFSAKGNEYYNTRSQFVNEILVYNPIEMNFAESVTGFGLRYRFSNYNFITVNADFISFDEKNEDINPNGDYNMKQVYFNYTVKF